MTQLKMFLTAACAALLTLVTWTLAVMVLDGYFRAVNDLVWAGTLWASAMICSGAVAYSRYAVRPVLACTLAFGVFGVTYLACEGPIFGAVAEGGDPALTQFVVLNFVFLPLGVLAATEVGSWLGRRRGPIRAA